MAVTTPTQAEVQEFYTLREGVKLARPRPFIERYFKIRNLQGHNVPMLYTEDQAAYYEQSFLTLTSYDDPAYWLLYKAREAFSTTKWVAEMTAFHLCVPGFIGDVVIDSDKNLLKSVLPLHSHFINNLPPWMAPKTGYWDKDIREIIHSDVKIEGGKPLVMGTNASILTFSSVRSKNYGRGGRPKWVLLSECGSYDPEHAREIELSLADSMTEYSWRTDESTPKGGTVFHESFKRLRDKQLTGRILKRYWFQKGNAFYPPNHVLRREEDRGREKLDLTDEEKQVVQRFPPTDKVSSHDRIAWRRARIAKLTAASYGDMQYATALFQQEHPEDDVTPWQTVAATVLPRDAIQRLLSLVLPPLESGILIPGAEYKIWGHVAQGAIVIAGMDPARGGRSKTGDPLAMEVIDPRSGLHLAEVFGRANVTLFTRACVNFLESRFKNYTLVIEDNGVGLTAIEEAKRLNAKQYTKPLKNPLNPQEKLEVGWTTTGPNKASMHESLYQGLNDGTLITRSVEMLQDLTDYDPNEKDHTPDRVMALMIARAVISQRRLSLDSTSNADELEVAVVGRY